MAYIDSERDPWNYLIHGNGFGEPREEVEALIAKEMTKAEERPEELGYQRYR